MKSAKYQADIQSIASTVTVVRREWKKFKNVMHGLLKVPHLNRVRMEVTVVVKNVDMLEWLGQRSGANQGFTLREVLPVLAAGGRPSIDDESGKLLSNEVQEHGSTPITAESNHGNTFTSDEENDDNDNDDNNNDDNDNDDNNDNDDDNDNDDNDDDNDNDDENTVMVYQVHIAELLYHIFPYVQLFLHECNNSIVRHAVVSKQLVYMFNDLLNMCGWSGKFSMILMN